MHINWQKTLLITLDVALATYLGFAFTKFNQPDEKGMLCTKVNINIEDEMTNGFLNAKEIKKRLEIKKLYPLEKPLSNVNARKIEETLKTSPFVKTAECYKTQDGLVDIYLTQRMPIVRIKSINNEDYYIDDHYQVMPNTNYTSDIIIATGNINKWFAQKYISLVSNIISKREQDVEDFINRKMDRLEKFYKYGLSQAGWNKYSYINIEFDNQIICTKHHNS